MIKRILVTLSGTPYTATAVRRAVELARDHEAEVTGVTVADWRIDDIGGVPVGGASAARELREHRRSMVEESIEAQLESFAAACREAGVRHVAVREKGDAFSEVLALWRYHDLTLIGLRGLYDHGVVKDPDDVVLQLISRGVRPMIAVAEKYRPIRKVLIAYNGSVESAQAMKNFVQKRPWEGIELRIVAFRSRRKASKLLADAAAYCRAHDYSVETDFVDQAARDHLLSYASGWDTDLIVMGSTSRARILKRVLGDTASALLRNVEIPLFLAQ